LSFSCLFILIFGGKCPPKEVFDPCLCNGTIIECFGDTSYNLKAIFQNASKSMKNEDKNFDTFAMTNQAIEELEDNTFADITFKEILLKNTMSLKIINSNTFSPNNTKTIEVFRQSGDSKIGSEKYLSQLFDAMTSLANVREIYFDNSSLRSIPSHAFNSTNDMLKNLVKINFNENTRMYINYLGEYAFYNLNNLTFLSFYDNTIDHIPKHAFDFEKPSNDYLFIDLGSNYLNETGFEVGMFTESKRPLNISLVWNQISVLDEKVFLPILSIDKRNTIDFSTNPFVCDCRMQWLFKAKSLYQNQVKNIKCFNQKEFWSLTDKDFEKCHQF
jgi:hypothetical protein